MINTLIKNIKNYSDYLKKCGMYISVHTDFTEYMLELIDLNIHRNPKCLLVKSNDEKWKECIRVHNSEMYSNSVRKRVCPYGVSEYVFNLNCAGTMCVSPADELDDNEVDALVSPLCRMIEYLKALSQEGDEEVSNNETVNRAVKFIQRNFCKKITNDDIARVCSCSVSSLCHLFKEFKGVSVHKFILELRMSYAKELLEGSNLSVFRIAEKAGFSDYNCFCVRFKKETAMTPTEYRKSIAEALSK